MLYSGIDFHRYHFMITTINDFGSIIRQQKVPNDEFSIIKLFLF